MISTLLILVFACLWFNYQPETNYHRPKWMIGSLVAVTLLGIKLASVTSVLIAPIFCFVAMTSCYYGISNYDKHWIKRVNKGKPNNAFVVGLLRSAIAVMSIMLFISLPSETFILKCILVMPAISIIASLRALIPRKKLLKWCEKKKTHLYCWGFGNNPSVNSTFISLCSSASLATLDVFPSLLWVVIFSQLLSFAAIVRMKGSAGLGAFIASVLIYIAYLNIFVGIGALVLSVGLIFTLNYLQNGFLFSLSGRKELYLFGKNNLHGINSKLIGSGNGSFVFLFPYLQTLFAKQCEKRGQKVPKALNSIFIWLHNDVVQHFLENGYIGALLLLVAATGVSIQLFEAPIGLTCFFVAYAVNSFCNFPNHMAPDTAVMSVMIRFLYMF